MGNYVPNYIQTWVRVSKFANAHDHASQKSGAQARLLIRVLRISKTNVLRHCFMCQSWIQRRVRKLKLSGGTSFRLHMLVVR